MSILELQNVQKIYGEKENQVKALQNINLQVEKVNLSLLSGHPDPANRLFLI